MLEEALKEFGKALVQQGVYAPGHQNLDRACSGAKDFADFLLEGPAILRKGRVRKDA